MALNTSKCNHLMPGLINMIWDRKMKVHINNNVYQRSSSELSDINQLYWLLYCAVHSVWHKHNSGCLSSQLSPGTDEHKPQEKIYGNLRSGKADKVVRSHVMHSLHKCPESR